MKSKEIINEGIFSDFERTAQNIQQAYQKRSNATSGLGGRIKAFLSPTRQKYGRSTQDQVAANKFINKFVTGALETLNVAVKNDLVDINSNELAKPATITKTQQKPSLAKDIEVVNNEPMILRYRGVDYYIGDKGQWLNAKTNKEPPQSFQKFLNQQADIATPTSESESNYDKMNKIFESYMQLLEASAVPYPQRPFNPSTPGSAVPQGGGRFKGAPLSQTPNAVRKRNARAAKKANPQVAQKPGAPAQGAAPDQKTSISAYFKERFLDSFLQGIDMGPAQAKVDALLQNLPNLYKSGQLKKELENIANIAWTMAKKNG